ncbi:hypothetical protein CsSME_00011548 [Camellia sinensis var. sinensis]
MVYINPENISTTQIYVAPAQTLDLHPPTSPLLLSLSLSPSHPRLLLIPFFSLSLSLSLPLSLSLSPSFIPSLFPDDPALQSRLRR